MTTAPDPAHVSLRALMALEPAARGLSLSARQRAGSVLAGPHGSRLRGRGLDFVELRRYLPGDDLRQLDARASLRLGKPFVRVYSEERDRPVVLLIDQRMSMFFGSVRFFKSVIAAELAALCAWAALRAGDRVGGAVMTDEGVQTLRPLRSRAGVQALLGRVANANAALSAQQRARDAAGVLDTALRTARGQAPHDCLIVVISDFAGAGVQTESELRRLRAHNDVIAMLVYDPLAQRLPRGGRVRVSQGEVQLDLSLAQARTHRPLADFFSQRLSGVSDILRAARVPVLPIGSDDAALPQLRRALGLLQDAPRREAA
ncbi:DUF58 domain-containing protein [Bordetella genomosp. 5]|uniref:DUF58 domain-containing protein n=1 Tax=Bordetella genomosp. 5 TaxID=1395608 RepID=A0A261TQT7_9BORD|nr:DUF58 domain-containing protein [Bordetella genomosp. 5]OZI52024.1 DUF58 domain-containing protein [Bordetella genomosp. 5]